MTERGEGRRESRWQAACARLPLPPLSALFPPIWAAWLVAFKVQPSHGNGKSTVGLLGYLETGAAHTFCSSWRQIAVEASCCDNRAQVGLESSDPRASFPLPSTHLLHQPGVCLCPRQPSGIPGSATTWGLLEAPSCSAGGPGQIPDLRPDGLRVGGRGEGRCSLPLASALQSQLYFAWINSRCCVTAAPLRWLHLKFPGDPESYGQ